MEFLKSRIFGVRVSVLSLLILAVVFLLSAILPDSSSRAGWLLQVPKDTGYVLLGLFSLYAAHLTFSHLRMHELLKTPDEFSWKHIVFASSILVSCAIIIGSILG